MNRVRKLISFGQHDVLVMFWLINPISICPVVGILIRALMEEMSIGVRPGPYITW
jgi:hypothetical protein